MAAFKCSEWRQKSLLPRPRPCNRQSLLFPSELSSRTCVANVSAATCEHRESCASRAYWIGGRRRPHVLPIPSRDTRTDTSSGGLRRTGHLVMDLPAELLMRTLLSERQVLLTAATTILFPEVSSGRSWATFLTRTTSLSAS